MRGQEQAALLFKKRSRARLDVCFLEMITLYMLHPQMKESGKPTVIIWNKSGFMK
jgi:hypothetical protein